MNYNPYRTARHGVGVLLASYLAAACTVSQYQGSASLAPQGTPPLRHARVFLVGESKGHDLSDVVVIADSLLGVDQSGARFAVPATSVAAVETRRFSASRTARLIGIALLSALLAIGAQS